METKPWVILSTLDPPGEPGGHVTELWSLELKWVEARPPHSLETLQLSPPLLRRPWGHTFHMALLWTEDPTEVSVSERSNH